MSALFNGGHQELTADTVAHLFEPRYSDVGSHAKGIEDLLMFNMEMLLQKAEGGGKLLCAKLYTYS